MNNPDLKEVKPAEKILCARCESKYSSILFHYWITTKLVGRKSFCLCDECTALLLLNLLTLRPENNHLMMNWVEKHNDFLKERGM